MQLIAQEDIEAPVEFVFDQISDFPRLERSALRRGVDIQRIDCLEAPGPGMAWDASFEVWRKSMRLTLELSQFDRPNGMVLIGRSSSLGGTAVLDLVTLSRSRTRISLRLNIRAETLMNKLFLQSVKLARVDPSETFRKYVAAYATGLEERYNSCT